MNIVVKIEIDGKEVRRCEINHDESLNGASTRHYSEYARFFDEACLGWSRDPEFNLLFLRQAEANANALLKSRGYVFLNEVYDLLGMARSEAGQLVGWIYKGDNPIGDNYIDFGIFNHGLENRDYITGLEKSILLDFNVDGEILGVLREKES